MYFKRMSLNAQKCMDVGKSTVSDCITLLSNDNPSDFAIDGTIQNNLRYIGANPDNYVSFNGEEWRIIGVFKDIDDGVGKKELRTKIIRTESMEYRAWDASSNDWNTADIKDELNGSYLSGLSTGAKEMINQAKWNIGKSSIPEQVVSAVYNQERNGSTWIGKIALMDASDYGYAVGGEERLTCLNSNLYDYYTGCYADDWLYNKSSQWTLTASSSYSDCSFLVFGSYVDDIYVGNERNVRPTLYLSSNVEIIGGSGTSIDPYILGLQ